MMLSDAISAARTEHEVYFLLTSYIEALGHSAAPGSLPDALLALPLSGRSDLERRAAVLGRRLDDDLRPRRGEPGRTVVGEAFGVMVTALLTLERIDAEQRENLDEARIARDMPAWPLARLQQGVGSENAS